MLAETEPILLDLCTITLTIVPNISCHLLITIGILLISWKTLLIENLFWKTLLIENLFWKQLFWQIIWDFYDQTLLGWNASLASGSKFLSIYKVNKLGCNIWELFVFCFPYTLLCTIVQNYSCKTIMHIWWQMDPSFKSYRAEVDPILF